MCFHRPISNYLLKTNYFLRMTNTFGGDFATHSFGFALLLFIGNRYLLISSILRNIMRIYHECEDEIEKICREEHGLTIPSLLSDDKWLS